MSTKIQTTIPLSLYNFPKMEQYFPNDPYSDITIILDNKNYKLQKAYLRFESLYFYDNFEDDKNLNILIINKKFDHLIFEKILRTFYGSQVLIYVNEIYSAFEICQFLKSDALISQFVEEILKNFKNLNFYLVFQMAFLHNVEELLMKCVDFLKVNGLKNMMNEVLFIKTTKIPTTIFALGEETFKNLMILHNKLMKNSDNPEIFLNSLELFSLIKNYVTLNFSKDDQIPKLKELVIELINKNTLSAKEYKKIYHQELVLFDEDFYDKDSMFLKKKDDIYNSTRYNENNKFVDVLESENLLFRKEMDELTSERNTLIEEIKNMKIEFKSEIEKFRKSSEDKYINLTERFQEFKNETLAKEYQSNLRISNLELKLSEHPPKKSSHDEILLKIHKINENTIIQRASSETNSDIIKKANNLINNSIRKSSQPLRSSINRCEKNEKKESQNEITQESFYFFEKNNFSLEYNETSKDEIFEKLENSVLINYKSDIITKNELDLFKRWFEIKIYERLKLKLIFSSKIEALEKSKVLNQITSIDKLLIIIKEEEDSVIGGYSLEGIKDDKNIKASQHSNFCFKNNEKHGCEGLIYLDKGILEFKNLIKLYSREKCNDYFEYEEKEIKISVIEIYKVHIDSEMEL